MDCVPVAESHVPPELPSPLNGQHSEDIHGQLCLVRQLEASVMRNSTRVCLEIGFFDVIPSLTRHASSY